jgi:hypothetical protein
MSWPIFDWVRLANLAAGGLMVLAVGSLAARFCRQPVRRARLILLTLLSGVAVPCLGALQVAPRWSAGLLPAAGSPSPQPRPDLASRRGESNRPRLPGTMVSRDVIGRTAPSGPMLAGPDTPGSVHPRDSSEPARSSPKGWWTLPSAQTLLVGCYFAAAAGWTAWWLLGQIALWRVGRRTRPVSEAVREAFLDITGPAGAHVVLLESDRIARPCTHRWIRPVILLPATLCDDIEPRALRYVLAHEWSHVERRDAWAWNLACLAGIILLYQPLFWWLRRQLRLCQDYLADARAAAEGSAEDYAALLVCLARAPRSDPAPAALGIGDRRSNLHRRVLMLVQDHEPLEHRCRTAWSLATAGAAAGLIIVASGLHLDAAAPPVPLPKNLVARAAAAPVQDVPRPPAASRPAGETLSYTGTVKDKDTGKPIVGATVVVRRSVSRAEENRVLQETRHTTGVEGTYTFTIPPEQVAEPFLHIELDVEHPDYATRAGFGYALSMIRKNERLNERPFFETIEMRPAQPITGRIATPEGKPAAGVELLAYSRTDRLTRGQWEYGSFARVKTDAEGRFRLPITTPGRAVYWVLPRQYAPELHVLAEGTRGDLGTIVLKPGVTVTGRVLDVQGRPLAGVAVEARREGNAGPEFQALGRLGVAHAIERTADTDAEGRFRFDPLPPGSYRVMPTDVHFGGDRSAGWTRRELPGVFAPTKLLIRPGDVPEPLEVHASPPVVIEGTWLDSNGRPKSGWSSTLFGRIDGAFWYAMTRPDAQGKFSLKVPRGVEQAELDISTNEHAAALHRIGKDGPLLASRRLPLGTLDHDVTGIEIVRYVAPILVINATTEQGRQIKGFNATVEYAAPGPNSDGTVRVVGGGPTLAVQDEQYDGRYRTWQLLPDREVIVTVAADGFATARRSLTLPEGKTEELNFRLERN